MKATAFIKPLGTKQTIEIEAIYPDDEAYFKAHGVAISLEEDYMPGSFIYYADYGAVSEDGDPDEVIVLTDGKSSQDSLHELRLLVESGINTLNESLG